MTGILKKPKSNFTMMECIAVMVIIIVLTVLILPAYVKSREIGKNIVCKSNLKTLGEAALSYAGNNSGISPVMISFSSNFLCNFYQDFRNSVAAAPKGSKVVIKNPDKYLPTPRLISGGVSINTTNVATMSVLFPSVYPADYSSPLSCPSQKLEWRNELLTKQLGITSSTTATYGWMGTHYACSYGARLSTIKTMEKHVMFADSYSPAFLGNTVYLMDAQIYGRHFGTPVFQSSTFALQASQHSYEYHGSGSSNMVMWDGHVESWTWAAAYNHWSFTYCPFNSGTYSISYH